MAATKRVKRRVKADITFLALVGMMVGIGLVGGFFISKKTTEPIRETIYKTIETPVYAQSLPEAVEVYYYDIPLSHSLQEFIYECCADEDLPVSLIFALIEHESSFNPETISETNDYGLMQINAINHDKLAAKYRTADMLDPYQNVYCGIKIVGAYVKKYEGNYDKALMAYNMGEYGAMKCWEDGIVSSKYSTRILQIMSEYEEYEYANE